jgi:outer membrane protein
MKKPIRSLFALLGFGAATLALHAQPALKVAVVDLAKLYDTHFETVDQNAKLQADDQRANEEVDKMNKEGNALVEEFKALKEQSENPALTADAKSKAAADAQKKLETIKQKETEVRTFIQNTQTSLRTRLQNFRTLMIEKISKTAVEVAKRKGATVLLDKAGPTLIGVSSIIYFDPSYDITDDVAKEIAKERPASATGAPAAAAPTTGDVQKITVPGVTPKK